jgi:FAD/FMN-containing dehydrogenase
MKKSILKILESTIQGKVLSQKEFKRFYSVDASSYQIIPKIIVVAKNEKDVINTVKIAKKFKTSVTVRGAGTSLVGNALNDGIILDMKNNDDKYTATISIGQQIKEINIKLSDYEKLEKGQMIKILFNSSNAAIESRD